MKEPKKGSLTFTFTFTSVTTRARATLSPSDRSSRAAPTATPIAQERRSEGTESSSWSGIVPR